MLYISLVKMLWALVHCKECSVNMDWAGLSCVHYSLKALCGIMSQSELTTSCKAVRNVLSIWIELAWAGLSCVHYSLKALCDIMRQSELTTSCKARAEMARGIFYLMTFNPDCLQRVNSITRISGVNQQIVHLKSKNGMLRHSFLRVGEDISLQHFIVPSFSFLLCLAVYNVSIPMSKLFLMNF